MSLPKSGEVKQGIREYLQLEGDQLYGGFLAKKRRGSGLSLRQANRLSFQLKALDCLSAPGMKNLHNTLFSLSWKEKVLLSSLTYIHIICT